MASNLTPLGVFAKWVAAPIAVFAIGYFVVGPRLGGSPSSHAPKESSQPDPEAQSDSPGSTDDATTAAAPKSGATATPSPAKSTDGSTPAAPEVDVSVGPDDGRQPAVSVDNLSETRHKKAKKKKPKKPVAASPPDEGSVGGTENGGDNGTTTGGGQSTGGDNGGDTGATTGDGRTAGDTGR